VSTTGGLLSFWSGNLVVPYLTLKRVSENALFYSVLFVKAVGENTGVNPSL